MSNSPAIQLDGIAKSYGTVRAVRNLSLTVPAGAVYGFLGPNGSGKTTSIRMMVNILVPDGGTVRIQGQPVGPHTKDLIGYLPEERGLYAKMKVRELIEFFAELKKVPPAVAKPRVMQWLERVELGAWADKKVNELSKGMQQKIQFVVAVIADPPILILDEFSSGLDPINANLLKDVLLELRAQGKTILFSTHRMEEAERLCDHVCLIDHGQKVLDGRLDAIRSAAGKSTIRVDYRGDAALLRRAPGVSQVDDYGNYAELRLGPEAQNAAGATAILRALAPQLDITRFELLEPTLNQIFLDTVGAAQASKAAATPAGV
ncbi:MAG TPA: ATP-binding cassette domain-containing protein [Terriglobales bacterium]|nr:ATP-binding cassette domain-containing protein [Terriglobales bacterium]